MFEPIPTDDPDAFAAGVGRLVGAPVGLLSFGPTATSKRPPRTATA